MTIAQVLVKKVCIFCKGKGCYDCGGKGYTDLEWITFTEFINAMKEEIERGVGIM